MSTSLLKYNCLFVKYLLHRSLSNQRNFDLGKAIKLLNDRKQFQNAIHLFNKHNVNQIETLSSLTITQVLKACANLQNITLGSHIHQLISPRVNNDPFILTSLIHLYMQCGDVKQAESLFNKSRKTHLPLYGAMMKGYIKNRLLHKVLDIFKQIKKPSEVNLIVLFNACATLKTSEALELVKQVSKEMPKFYYSNPHLLTSLLDALMKCGDVEYAQLLFNQSKIKVMPMFGAMMSGYVENNEANKAIDLFQQIKNPDEIVTLILFHACALLKTKEALNLVKKVSKEMPNLYYSNPHLVTSLLDSLMKCGDIQHAESLFDQSNIKALSMFGAMMRGYITNNQIEKSIQLFQRIRDPDETILIILFNACASLRSQEALNLAKKLSTEMPKILYSNPRLVTSLLDSLIKCGDVNHAQSLFDQSSVKDLHMFGAMMNGFVQNNQADKAIHLFHQIKDPDAVILIILFNACGSLKTEEALNLVKKVSKELPDIHHTNPDVLSALLDSLMKCGDVEYAEWLFEKSKVRSSSMFGAMMNGFNLENSPLRTLEWFNKLKVHGFEANLMVYLSVIRALSKIGDYLLCESMIKEIPNSFLTHTETQGALISMWGKAGCIDKAQEIFEKIPRPNIVDYSAMIHSYGLNGMCVEAIELYHRIPRNTINERVHICVLNACSHSGFVDKARPIFGNIKNKTERIYTTMIDCLSRASLFEEAQCLIDEYERSQPPVSTMYMALLSGARNVINTDLAKKIYRRMNMLFPQLKESLVSAAVLLINSYSSAGETDKALEIKNDLYKSNLKKKIGLSWTVVNGRIYEFRAHDRSHPRSDEIYMENKKISKELLDYGHKYDSSWITRPLDQDETIESVLCGHSERLAIAWNFVVNPKATKIQVTKNLRVCGECHQSTKSIALIRQCEIVVRDSNRIHHFYKNGQCSCNDYF